MSEQRPTGHVSGNTLNVLESLYSPNGARLYDLDVVDVVRELRKLREENARLEELLNRAARIASELTGFPWPLPKPPEVR